MKLTDEMRKALEAKANEEFDLLCDEKIQDREFHQISFVAGAEAALELVDESELVKALEFVVSGCPTQAKGCKCVTNTAQLALAKYRAGGT